jgi:hypothetical protein
MQILKPEPENLTINQFEHDKIKCVTNSLSSYLLQIPSNDASLKNVGELVRFFMRENIRKF